MNDGVIISKIWLLIAVILPTSGSPSPRSNRFCRSRGNGFCGFRSNGFRGSWSNGFCGFRSNGFRGSWSNGFGGSHRRGGRSFLFRPCERFAHPAALQDDVIPKYFRKPDAGGNILAFVHRKNLLRIELHHRVSAPAARGRHDAEQLDRNPGRRGAALVALQAAEHTAGGGQIARLPCGGLRPRFRARGKPNPGPVREHETKQRQRGKRQQRHEGRLRKTRSSERECLHSSSFVIRALQGVWVGRSNRPDAC